MNKKSRIIQWRELAELPADTIRIDVRTDEYKLGTIPGFINIPVDELREHLDELPKEKPIVVTCAVGLRGYLAYRILVQKWLQACAQPIRRIQNMERSDRTDKRDRFPQAGNTGKHKLWKLRFPDQSVESRCLRTDVSRTCDAIEKNYEALKIGEQLQITATDQAFGKDVTSWCKMTGAELVAPETKGGL